MRLFYEDGTFRKFNEIPSVGEACGPQGFALEQVTPKIGDTIQHPHDANGYIFGWLAKVKLALPDGLALGYGGGLDNDVYNIEKEVA